MKQTQLNSDLFPEKPIKHVERLPSDGPTSSGMPSNEKAARQPGGGEQAEEHRIEALKNEGKIIVVDWEEVSSSIPVVRTESRDWSGNGES